MYLEFFNKAKENLEVAEDSFKKSRYNACANRAYFALYQAAVALLIKTGIKPPRKMDFGHEWVQANFVVSFIKRKKVFSQKYANYLNDLRNLREIADYKSRSISKKQAQRALNKSNQLIELISNEI